MLPLHSSSTSTCKECITLVEKVQDYNDDSRPSVRIPQEKSYIPGLHSDAITNSVSDEHLAPLSVLHFNSTININTSHGSTSTDHPAWSPGHPLLNHCGTFRLKPTRTTQQV